MKPSQKQPDPSSEEDKNWAPGAPLPQAKQDQKIFDGDEDSSENEDSEL